MAILYPDDKNFKQYAVENYVNKACLSADEFWEDFNRMKYIKRLLKKYKKDGVLKERLILNHLVSFYNVFEISAANRMLFHKIEPEIQPALKTFLVFLNYLPSNWFVEVPLDSFIVDKLRKF
jgi:sulfur relay (sulfurtransferase) DsrC/TusE family protein